jgi:hypothetical protein
MTRVALVVIGLSTASAYAPRSPILARPSSVLRSASEDEALAQMMKNGRSPPWPNEVEGARAAFDAAPSRSTRAIPDPTELERSARRGEVAPDVLGMDDRRVRPEQEAINELAFVRAQPLMRWGDVEASGLLARVVCLWLGLFQLVCLPVVRNYDDMNELLRYSSAQSAVLAAVPATAMALAVVLRLLAGWRYVGSRLLGEELYFEESGWYDGFEQVKPAKTLFRDRLVYRDEVAPALRRLAPVALGTAALLIIFAAGDAALFANFAEESPGYLQSY